MLGRVSERAGKKRVPCSRAVSPGWEGVLEGRGVRGRGGLGKGRICPAEGARRWSGKGDVGSGSTLVGGRSKVDWRVCYWVAIQSEVDMSVGVSAVRSRLLPVPSFDGGTMMGRLTRFRQGGHDSASGVVWQNDLQTGATLSCGPGRMMMQAAWYRTCTEGRSATLGHEEGTLPPRSSRSIARCPDPRMPPPRFLQQQQQ